MSSKPIEKLFDAFVSAKTQEELLDVFKHIQNKVPTHQSNQSIAFYHQLKKRVTHWRAQSIWDILDERAKQAEYRGNVIATGKKILVIGAGPVGLRMAIECALLDVEYKCFNNVRHCCGFPIDHQNNPSFLTGSEAHIIEKRTSATRNNVLHLWQFTIEDLLKLGAKKFYGQFCAGSINHISM
eukprot:sb/3471524/